MPEVEMVDGEDISHEDANAPGWQTALSKNRRSPRQQEAISIQSVGTSGHRMATAQDVVRRLAAASRLPPFAAQPYSSHCPAEERPGSQEG
ncbi:hypothetical protein MTO96_041191 [Rhipicephalus appendiculatus]